MTRRGVTRCLAVVLGAALTLSACTYLPTSGPSELDIARSADVTVGRPSAGPGLDYVLLPLTKQTLQYFQQPSSSSLAGFGGGHGPAPDQVFGVGDVVQVSIFESESGGLFIPKDAGSRPGNYVTLPQQTIDSSGAIAVPYAGKIKVAGRTAQQVETDIRAALANRAIEPQVVVTLIQSRSNLVSVLGDVNTPQELVINPRERIVDEIARAGGLSTPGIETYVTLTRGGRQRTVLFNTLVQDPRENIFVAAGDVIFVNRERRTYLVFGAATENGRIDFEESGLSLAEAVAKAGGLIDQRAQPRAVYDYRIMPRSVLEHMGIDLSKHPGDRVPVIFQVDLRDPTGFFAAESFPMQDKDIVYVGNSGATGLIKFLSVLTTVTDSAATVTGDAVATRNSLRDLGH